MEAKAGDRLVVESEKVGQATRTGIIEEVLAEDPPRYRVQWEDGRTTLYTPQAGAAKIEAAGQGEHRRVRIWDSRSVQRAIGWHPITDRRQPVLALTLGGGRVLKPGSITGFSGLQPPPQTYRRRACRLMRRSSAAR